MHSCLSSPPPNTQANLLQAPACLDNGGAAIGNTACVLFNSRGIPIDGSGNITGNSALYLSDGTATYGITLSATPLIRLWWSKADEAKWVKR